jgi:signal transduction histidine kinase
LLKRTTAEGAPQNQLDRIQQAAKRLDASTRSLLNLARRPVPEETEVAPLAALQALVPLMRVTLPAPTALALDLPEAEPWRVRFDRAAFDEAMIALAREAAAAMPRAASLGLMLRQEAEAVSLLITWPEGAAPPGEALVAALAGLGAKALQDGKWELRWARPPG